jgi:hypothetical protein
MDMLPTPAIPPKMTLVQLEELISQQQSELDDLLVAATQLAQAAAAPVNSSAVAAPVAQAATSASGPNFASWFSFFHPKTS